MITEAIFSILFTIPAAIIRLIPSIPLVGDMSKITAVLELFAIGNQFFPVGELFSYMSVWLALNVIGMTKSFIDWILSLIPMY